MGAGELVAPYSGTASADNLTAGMDTIEKKG
jgi:hypothetical protein